MPTPTFQRLTVDQFATLLQKFPFRRRVNAVHMHHTWRPRRADFKGHETIVSMWRFHTQTNGWSDIAQHITIDPHGMIWLGRNWNLPPASAGGHNGNSAAGPFMFEMVGDFDAGPGHDVFDGPQRDTVLKVIALVQQRFGLEPGTLRFHNMMSNKTCPGSAIDFQRVLQGVAAAREALQGARALGDVEVASPFPEEEELAIQQAIRELSRVTELGAERPEAEHVCAEDHLAHDRDMPLEAIGEGAAGRGPALDPDTLAKLRPHLVNLRAGKFSSEGEMTSSPEDVDAIFEEHLPRWMASHDAGRARVVFFAHGGLVSESRGLGVANKHVQWWLDNGVYPIYFVWETGFFETIGQLLERARGGTRDLADFTTDPLIEAAARALQAQRIWGGMKWAAERAAEPSSPGAPMGGACYVAQKLKEFCDEHGERIELHAAGHSAGSIFHAYFLPLAQHLGVPAWKSLHFMAPAIRVDTFKAKMLDRLQDGLADSTTIYTMRRDFERRDNCAMLYRKSLLYLIYHALEDEVRTPILGLEESLRSDRDLKAFFGLGGGGAQGGEVVWSVSASDTGRSASQATSHGDFDDDAPTMNSIVRRVLGKQDADPIVGYRPQPQGQGQRGWDQQVDWPYTAGMPGDPRWAWKRPWKVPHQPPMPVPLPPAPVMPPPGQTPGPAAGPAGRQLALCIGVDEYPDPRHRLAGCVNDARTWAGALSKLGFQARMLVNGQATRAAIDRELRDLVTQSRAGDVIVVQYAGHGTTVSDLDGDETDGRDEALCPVDFASGALYIDDDIAKVFAQLPDGVNLTVFMDCCHSGTNTRFAVGLNPGELDLPPDSKARYVLPTLELDQAHAQFREHNPGLGGTRAGGTGGPESMRHVKFSACLDHEVALESGGNGEFTRRAMRVLGRGIRGLSNEGFLNAVLTEFGSGARQKPMLDCATPAKSAPLLQPVGSGHRAGPDGAFEASGATSRDAVLLQAVSALAQSVQALTRC